MWTKFLKDEKNKKYNAMLFRINELEEKKEYNQAFKACMMFIQIINYHIAKENVGNSILEFMKYYKMKRLENLYNILKKILVIYEKYPSDFIDLDYKNLKFYTIKMIEEINANKLN